MLKNSILPLTIIGLTIVACIFYWVSLLETQQSDMDVAKHGGELHVQQINEAVDQQLDATIRSVDTAIRHLRTVYLHDRKDFDRSVRDMLDAYPKGMLQFVIVIRADGFLEYSSDAKPKLLNFGDREHFRVHAESKEDQLFISKPIVGRISGLPLIQCTRTIRDGNRFVGVIGVPLRPDYISNNLWTLHINPSDLISIVREDGRIIARSRNLEEGLKLTTPADRPFMHSHAGDHGIFRETSITDKVPLLFSWRHLDNYPIIAVAAIDEVAELRGISAQQSDAKKRTLQAITMVVFFAILISFLILRLNRNNVQLTQSRMMLHESEVRLRAMLENDLVGIVTVKERTIQWANPAFEKMLGYQKGELNGTPTKNNYLNEDEYRTLGQSAYPILKGGKLYRIEIEHKRKDGSHIWVDLSGALLEPDTGETLWAFIDITERKLADEMLRKLSIATEQSPASVVITDLDGYIQYVNPRFTEVTGYSAAEVVGQNPRFLQSGQTPNEIHLDLWDKISQGQIWHGELINKRKNGEIYWEDAHISPVKNLSGVITHYVAVKIDTTDRKQRELELRKYKHIIEFSDDAIIGKSLSGIIQSWNQGAVKIFGYTAEEAIGSPIQLLIPPDYLLEESKLLEAVARGENIDQYETIRTRKDGQLINVAITLSPIYDQLGKVIGVSKVVRDITEHKKMEDQVHELAFYDPLTQLPNRRMFEDRLGLTLAASKRSGSYGALMFLDLDNFKPLNDTHGHAMGDLLLVEAADRLKGCVREVDTVARFGGDEFVIMLSELNCDKGSATNEASIVAEKIRASLSKPYLLISKSEQNTETIVEHNCTTSIGVCVFNHRESSQHNILQFADTAMYQAKESGRNKVKFYESAGRKA